MRIITDTPPNDSSWSYCHFAHRYNETSAPMLSGFLRRMRILSSGRLNKSDRYHTTYELVRMARQYLPKKLRKAIVGFLFNPDRNLPREFIPVLATLLNFRSLGEHHGELVHMIESGCIKVEGKIIPIKNWVDLLSDIYGKKLQPILWMLYSRWYPINLCPDPASIVFLNPQGEDVLDVRCQKEARSRLMKILSWAQKIDKSENWQAYTIKRMHQIEIPDLLRQYGFADSPQIISIMLKRAAKHLPSYKEWIGILRILVECIEDRECIRKIWEGYQDKQFARIIAGKRKCDLDLFKRVIRDVCALKDIGLRRKLVLKWLENHVPDVHFWVWMTDGRVISDRFYAKLVEKYIWDSRIIGRIEARISGKSIETQRKILISRIKFLKYLKDHGLDAQDNKFRERFLAQFPPRHLPPVLGMLKDKSRCFHAGRVISTYEPKKPDDQDSGTVTISDPQAIFDVFLGLITKDKDQLVHQACEQINNSGLIQRARDALSLKEKFASYNWMMNTLVDGQNLWESRKSPTKPLADELMEYLCESYGNRKPIQEILDKMDFSYPNPKEHLVLKIGGCSTKDMDIQSAEVGSCYFKSGAYEKNLVEWLVSPFHMCIYIQGVALQRKLNAKTEKYFLGVVMAIFADNVKTMIIDSVDGLLGSLRSYPGWENWLLSSLKDYARSLGVKRLIFNKNVGGNAANAYVNWLLENHATHKPLKPAQIPVYVRGVSMEFEPRVLRDSLVIPLEDKGGNHHE